MLSSASPNNTTKQRCLSPNWHNLGHFKWTNITSHQKIIFYHWHKAEITIGKQEEFFLPLLLYNHSTNSVKDVRHNFKNFVIQKSKSTKMNAKTSGHSSKSYFCRKNLLEIASVRERTKWNPKKNIIILRLHRNKSLRNYWSSLSWIFRSNTILQQAFTFDLWFFS